MKKIILVLLVLFCGMGLFAEVQEFVVGCTFTSGNNTIFPALPYEYYKKNKISYADTLSYLDTLTYFSKIKPTGDGYFEVELYQCVPELDGQYFTFLVKKGDKFDMLMAFFDEKIYNTASSFPETFKVFNKLCNFNSTILDIRPNFIVIEFEIPTE